MNPSKETLILNAGSFFLGSGGQINVAAKDGRLAVSFLLEEEVSGKPPVKSLMETKQGFINEGSPWFVCHLAGPEIWVYHSETLERWHFSNQISGVEVVEEGEAPARIQQHIAEVRSGRVPYGGDQNSK